MIKIKWLFGVFFLLAFQLTYSSTQNTDALRFMEGSKVENQIHFEKTYFTQIIAGETPPCQLVVSNDLTSSKCFLPNYNSKHFQVTVIQGNYKFIATRQRHLFTGCASKRLFNVPIYLQTEKFRL